MKLYRMTSYGHPMMELLNDAGAVHRLDSRAGDGPIDGSVCLAACDA